MPYQCMIVLLILSTSPALLAQSPPPNFTQSPSPSPGHYKPPSLSDNADLDDPGLKKAIEHLFTGDTSGFQAELRNQAEAGNPAAQLMLGEQYIPKERYSTLSFEDMRSNKGDFQPKIIADTNTTPLSKLFAPSFPEALKWLTLASAQGSGEASELIAQIITRQLESHEPTTYTTADIDRFRKLAVQQGYDLENASVRCLSLTHDSPTLVCTSRIPDGCPTQDEMQQLRASGIIGTLQPQGGASAGLTSITLHPTTPPARALVILDHNITTEQRLPLPRHTSAIYVQQSNSKDWLVLPKTGPVVDRDIILVPGDDSYNAVMAYIQDIDGAGSGGNCIQSIGPFSH